MKTTKQVNVVLPEDLSRRIKGDAATLGVTLNSWAEQAFERFLGVKVEQRRVCLDSKKSKKILGRPLVSKAA